MEIFKKEVTEVDLKTKKGNFNIIRVIYHGEGLQKMIRLID